MEKAIEVKNLNISYRTIEAKSITKSLFSLKKTKTAYYQAVKDVSFAIGKGEIVGLVGRNGSGKSTLLRSLAGIFAPDSGSIELFGNSVSLLAIGVGFQNELTGRENIYLSGLLMGFTEEEIDEKYDEIVAFAELGVFINKPVKTYSSGMHSKLAFAITSILETDVMLVDETLSVGDRKFKKKSKKKMVELINDENRTVVIVSHSNDTLMELCSRGIWLNDGVVMADGPIGDVLKQYNAFMDDEKQARIEAKKKRQEKIKARRAKKAAKAAKEAAEREAAEKAAAEAAATKPEEIASVENAEKTDTSAE